MASGTVTAEGMKVQAQAEGGLAIRWGGAESEKWGTTASAKMENAKSLLPASTYNLKKWTYAKAKEAKNKTADPTTWENITNTVLGSTGKAYVADNGYVVMEKFEIRSTSTTKPALGLFVSNVTATSIEGKDIDAALRVGVHLVDANETGDGVFYIYGPVAGATDGYTWTDGADKATTKTVNLAIKGTIEDDNSQLIAKTADPLPTSEDTPVKVEIYIWYEGEDAKLYSDNYDANALSISVQFSSYGFKTTT